jgi:hypothetical protein
MKRLFGLVKIIYNYGGMLTPISFACFKNLIDFYYNGTRNNKPFFVENVNCESVGMEKFLPSPCFMGSLRNDNVLNNFISYIKDIIDNDYTNGSKITGKIPQWIMEQYNFGRVNIIKGYEVGVMTKDEKPVLVDDLMGNSYLNIDLRNTYGIWIPSTCILKRTNYQWFARMSEEQVLLSNVILGKYILKAVTPSREGLQPKELSESNLLSPESSPKDWVSFWNTPLYKGLYGLQPLYLGQDVPKNKEQDKKYKYVGVIA